MASRGKDYDYAGLVEIIASGKKSCTRCGKEKLLDDFSSNNTHPTGKKSECRACASKRHKTWRSKDIEGIRLKDRITHYIRKYGIPQEEAELLVQNRVGVCEICKQKHKLVIDHCHVSEKVRGRVCSACNSVLGYAKESKETLLSAIEYLDKYGE